MAGVRVSVPHDEPLVVCTVIPLPAFVYDFDPDARHVGAVTLIGGPGRIVMRDARRAHGGARLSEPKGRDMLHLSNVEARRLAISAQKLSPAARTPTIQSALSALRCVQLDPVSTVAPSHLIVLWSRVADVDVGELDRLLWVDRWLFEYWAHAASLVLTDDLPLHAATMERYRLLDGGSAYEARVRDWQAANSALHHYILQRLRADGPLTAAEFEDRASTTWRSGGWTSGKNVERMLDLLWRQGAIMVVGRRSRRRLWNLMHAWLPPGVVLKPLPGEEAVRSATEFALRALGVARAKDVVNHFTRNRYPGLQQVLGQLCTEGRVVEVRVEGTGEAWYLHSDMLPVLQEVDSGDWEDHIRLLSPFDNLICDRARTERLWNFEFRNEMYVPASKRRYGHYVLPILHGDVLIGRVAPRIDRRTGVLDIEGLYAEDTPHQGRRGPLVRKAIESLADFVGTGRVTLSGDIPGPWARALTSL